jgi:hypothetical protein
LQVNDFCPECATPVWSQRPPEEVSTEARRSFVWGLTSLILFFGCIGPLAGLVAILAVVYASKARREVKAGMVLPAQALQARTGSILGWITIGLSLMSVTIWGVLVFLGII